MVKPLDVLLRDTVAPLLAAEGYTRRGRVFTREAANGDKTFVEFRSHPRAVDLQIQVIIELDIQPAVFALWYRERGFDLGSGGILRRRLRHPDESREERDIWRFNLDDNETIAALRTVLLENARFFCTLLDRATLLEAYKDRSLPAQYDHTLRPIDVIALLLSDDGPSEELDELVAAIEASDFPDAEFIKRNAAAHAAERSK